MIEIKRSVLPNGLIVLTHEMPWVHSVYLLIGVKYGSALDPIGLEGMAHFIEHTVFKGTTNRSYEQIDTAIEDRGGILNAYTGEQSTCYVVKVVDSDLSIAWDVLSDIVIHPTFPENEIEKEKGPIIEEIKSYEDDDDNIINLNLDSIMFPGASFSRKICGSEETVSRITREDLARIWKKFYQPNNMMVVAVGNIKHETNLDFANEKFGQLSSQEITDNEIVPAETDPNKKEIIVFKPKIRQAKIMIGFKTIPYGANQRDTLALDLLADILGGGMSSVLFTEIRGKRGLVYGVGASHAQNKFAGGFQISSQFAPKKKEQIIKLINEILTNIDDYITDERFNRAIANERAVYMFKLESNSFIAKAIFSDEDCNSLNQLSDFCKIVESITMDDLRRVAKEYLNPEKAFTSSIEPEK
ncbi:MAG: pitrilysin family protein [Patescibacteria group bacterium]